MRAWGGRALAAWALERVIPRAYGAALAGDLLEEVHAGRPAVWYWRQVAAAMGVWGLRRVRVAAWPVVFSAAWSLVYPLWQIAVWHGPMGRLLFARWAALDWPYSAAYALGKGFLPSVTFLWLGFLVYGVMWGPRANGWAGLRMLGGLSLGLNVLLVATMVLSFWAGSSRSPFVGQENLDRAPYQVMINAPIALSLVTSLLVTFPARRQRALLS